MHTASPVSELESLFTAAPWSLGMSNVDKKSSTSGQAILCDLTTWPFKIEITIYAHASKWNGEKLCSISRRSATVFHEQNQWRISVPVCAGLGASGAEEGGLEGTPGVRVSGEEGASGVEDEWDSSNRRAILLWRKLQPVLMRASSMLRRAPMVRRRVSWCGRGRP